jgi:hypothetical protein
VRDSDLPAEDPDAAGVREWTVEEEVIFWAGRTAKPVETIEVIASAVAEAR